MKKIYLLALVMVCSSFLSCKENDSPVFTEDPPPDSTLAGSISFNDYRITAEGTYDGTKLKAFDVDSFMDIVKVSDTEVSFNCRPMWSDSEYKIVIPSIKVSGEPYNVAFDSTSANATVWYKETQYVGCEASVNGWIKRKSVNLSPASSHDGMPYPMEYTCAITISAEVSGKMLQVEILSVKPR